MDLWGLESGKWCLFVFDLLLFFVCLFFHFWCSGFSISNSHSEVHVPHSDTVNVASVVLFCGLISFYKFWENYIYVYHLVGTWTKQVPLPLLPWLKSVIPSDKPVSCMKVVHCNFQKKVLHWASDTDFFLVAIYSHKRIVKETSYTRTEIFHLYGSSHFHSNFKLMLSTQSTSEFYMLPWENCRMHSSSQEFTMRSFKHLKTLF